MQGYGIILPGVGLFSASEVNGTKLNYLSTAVSERFVISECFCRRSAELWVSCDNRSPTEALGEDGLNESDNRSPIEAFGDDCFIGDGGLDESGVVRLIWWTKKRVHPT